LIIIFGLNSQLTADFWVLEFDFSLFAEPIEVGDAESTTISILDFQGLLNIIDQFQGPLIRFFEIV